MRPGPKVPPVDLDLLVEVLDRYQVEYILVGGGAARVLGAQRPTGDTDCLARATFDNLERLAGAMRELKARIRVEGLSDEEATQLPTIIDGRMLAAMEISTWTTEAGQFDVLTDIPERTGARLRWEDLIDDAVVLDVAGAAVRVAPLGVIIASKEWANRPKDREALPELRRLRDESDTSMPQVAQPRPPSPPSASGPTPT
ncbi:MAG: hypothetical protein ACRDRT_07620 [Pseudonocardiaceae bacterium]